MRVSVIIPTLNERALLPYTIAAIEKCGVHEIIVADGGSTDGTCDWLEKYRQKNAAICLVRCERGRGAQLHYGARQATGDVLFFLHADCLPSAQSASAISRALKNQRVVGGCFRVGFCKRETNRALQLISRAINLRSHMARTATGDQGIFARRRTYEKIGGFKPWPLFEDIDFVTRLKTHGEFAVLNSTLFISARRWKTYGVWRTTFLMGVLLLGYHLKISPARLKRWFSDMTPSLPKHDEK